MKYFWWISQVAMATLSAFFFVFGIDLLIGSYSLKDPFSFIMTFFSASFIILFSLALFIVFLIKMIRVFRQVRSTPENEDPT